ncbi:hypothetical protein llap_14522 [Limosa lapponica baueri]|uniref:Uncharacterized protein n=1 Tax=Limosa lapponica baueri TaxID=1758121 RepID=A0A2I0TMZ2_LIMLA|nr:hypothetical protein llap_14522 [Limosa lapponica baueri]
MEPAASRLFDLTSEILGMFAKKLSLLQSCLSDVGDDANEYDNLGKVGNIIAKKSTAVGLVLGGRMSVTPPPFNLF